MTDLSAQAREALEHADARNSPGPWRLFRDDAGRQWITDADGLTIEGPSIPMSLRDQASVVEIVNLFPALASGVLALEAENELLREALLRTGARAAEGTGPLSRTACKRRAGSNPAPSVFNPPYRYESSVHGPATIYDTVGVGWIARVKESLPHKDALAAAMVEGLNRAASEASGG